MRRVTAGVDQDYLHTFDISPRWGSEKIKDLHLLVSCYRLGKFETSI